MLRLFGDFAVKALLLGLAVMGLLHLMGVVEEWIGMLLP